VSILSILLASRNPVFVSRLDLIIVGAEPGALEALELEVTIVNRLAGLGERDSADARSATVVVPVTRFEFDIHDAGRPTLSLAARRGNDRAGLELLRLLVGLKLLWRSFLSAHFSCLTLRLTLRVYELTCSLIVGLFITFLILWARTAVARLAVPRLCRVESGL